MALRQLDDRKQSSKTTGAAYVDPSKLAVGETIEGNFIGIKKRTVEYKNNETGKMQKFNSPDLLLKTADGSEFTVTGKGKIKYFEDDFVKKGLVKPGDYVVLTCWKSDAKNPGFNVAVDDEKAITVDTKSDF
jgi:hypothetical protein